MDRALKQWEIALIFGVLFTLVFGMWIGSEKQQLSDSVLRLHVIANSDSEEDQTLKLAVRDRVLEEVQSICPEDATLEEVKAALRSSLHEIANAGNAVVEERGYDYTVQATLTECWFPTKQYEGFALPAGEYQALRVVVGTGEGQNWWCVAFPPLCTGAASETLEEAVSAGYFSEDQVALVTENDTGYVLKFKCMEWLGSLEHMFHTN